MKWLIILIFLAGIGWNPAMADDEDGPGFGEATTDEMAPTADPETEPLEYLIQYTRQPQHDRVEELLKQFPNYKENENE